MKFGKVLKVSSENMPEEMHDLFLRYKELKKQIKLIPVSKDAAAGSEKQASVSPDGSVTGSGSTGQAAITATVLSPEEQAFITTLNEDLARFNRYFIEKEEEAVIRIQALCDELAAAAAVAGLHLPAALMDAATSLSDHEDEQKRPVAAFHGPAVPVAAAAATQPAVRPVGAAKAAAADSPATLSAAPAAAADVGPDQAAEVAPSKSDSGEPQQKQQEEEQRHRSHSHHSHHVHHDHHNHHNHHQGSGQHVGALQAVKSRLVQFHGEMVLLLHWSLLNYAAVVKILKKHDKRTGVLLRAPYLANVLQQPFSSTTIMSRLAKRAEELVVATTQLGPTGLQSGAAGPAEAGPGRAEGPGGATAAARSGAAAEPAATDKSGLHGVSAAAQSQPGGRSAAAPSGRGAASASEASTLTFATGLDREGAYGDATCHTEPLVGSTMHALKTWANLRKNAITPSTVLAAEVEQQSQQPLLGKRKAESAPPGHAASVEQDPEGKSPRRDAQAAAAE